MYIFNLHDAVVVDDDEFGSNVDSDVDSDVIEITEVDALFSKINKFYILKN